MDMALFVDVSRQKAKARIAITGVTGSGKTLGALYLAYGLAGDWAKVALIDTEHERGRFYADRSDFGTGTFKYASLGPPYTAERYKQFAAEGAKLVGPSGCVVVDSFSHAWGSEGGVIEFKNKIVESNPKKNDFSAWDDAGKVQNNLINAILSVDCHTIVTMRSKMEYVVEEDERGKKVPRRVGLAPVQRNDTEYEFDIVFEADRYTHKCRTVKDTTFLDEWNDVLTPGLGEALRAWLDGGKEPERLLCGECGKKISATATKTAAEVAAGTTEKTGGPLCMGCYAKRVKANGPQALPA